VARLMICSQIMVITAKGFSSQPFDLHLILPKPAPTEPLESAKIRCGNEGARYLDGSAYAACQILLGKTAALETLHELFGLKILLLQGDAGSTARFSSRG
jgi:hypothetical protein